MLKPAGYVTASIGKWHVGGEGFLPENQGFDLNVFGGAAGGTKKFGPWPSLPGTTEKDHIDTVLTDRAIQFIDTNKDKPFFLYLPYFEPHSKIESYPELVEKHKKRLESMPPVDPAAAFGDESPRKVRLVQNNPTYAAMMETVDNNVGRLVAHIDSLGLGDDTIILFTSDNGGLSTSEGSPTSNLPLRAGKGWLYEGGVRTILVARWKDHIKPGTTDHPVISTDFAPTILELTQSAAPAVQMDGRSFAPTLQGQSQTSGPLFWHYPHYGNQGSRPGSSMIDGNWKLIHWIEGDYMELFDLAADPGEKRDLSKENPDRVSSMRKQLDEFRTTTGARWPAPNPKFDPAKKEGR
jgi:arylsulfatase A-like enzyme